MTRKERNDIKKWTDTLSNEQLEKEYYDLVYDTLGTQTEDMYELGYDMQDIIEREKYEKFISQKCDFIGFICEQRGIKLWQE